MDKVETIQEFYQSKHEWMPDNIRKEIGHFNVFRLDPYVGKGAKPAPYRRRDYFKVMLVNGNGKFHYADKVIDVQKHALVFSNPQIPYSWEERDHIDGGFNEELVGEALAPFRKEVIIAIKFGFKMVSPQVLISIHKKER